MTLHTISLSIVFDAPLDQAWSEIVDWQSQGNWMLQTKVWAPPAPSPIEQEIFAFTGPLYRWHPRFKKIGILDHMRVSYWNPPFQCDVLHIGSVIQGTGTFSLKAISESKTRFDWSETIEAPRFIFQLIRPFFTLGVWISLQRLARILKNQPSERRGE